MKFVQFIVVAVLMWVTVPTHAQDSEKVASAEGAALRWLALTDAGDYARSWDAAAALFKKSISRDNWVNVIANSRQPLGSLLSRKVKSARFTRSLPGVPDGEYVIIQYETHFEHKDDAIETVTPLLEKDGSWKVSGYYIR